MGKAMMRTRTRTKRKTTTMRWIRGNASEFQEQFPVALANQAIDTIPLMFNLQNLVLYCTFPLTKTAQRCLAHARGCLRMGDYRI